MTSKAAEEKKVNTFDVMKLMSERNLDIRLSNLNHITNLTRTKQGTLVTFGVPGDLVAAIGIHGRFVGGLILCDRDQYRAIEEELRGRG